MKETQTIAFFNTNKAWGGGEKWHFEMALELKKRDYNIIVFAHINGELFKLCKENDIHSRAINVKKLTFLNPFAIKKLKNKLLYANADIIILNLPSDMKAGGLAAKKAGIKNIFYRRGTALPVTPHIINRYFFKNILTGIIANSEKTKQLINKNHKLIDNNKIFVLYNGMRAIFSNEAKEESDTFLIGNAGRLVYQKGQDYLIQLAELLNKESLDFEIRIAGDGPLEASLKKRIKEAQLQDHVKLLGFRKELNSFYNSLDLFVLPSRWEGFGYVMAEAMFHGIPVLAFDVSSNPEIIKDGENGYLVPFEDIHKLKEKIIELAGNPQMRKRMSQQAKAYALEHFSLSNSVKKLEDIINTL
ncbi:MAG: glycosyltransferase family 4 protein [Bacteroidales bacterium]|nr:glycosyltransferase family 4 protein [Bacteroidales bacterium]